MNPPLHPPQLQAGRDAEHLRLLAVFHFVVASFALCGLAGILLHLVIMRKIMAANVGVPKEAEAAMLIGYAIIAVLSVGSGVLNLLSGLFMRRRTARIYSLVVAGLNCVQFPFGTVLGVFTFIVLLRESVVRLYAVGPDAGPRS